MAAEANVLVLAELTGLGQNQVFVNKGTSQTVPTATTGIQYRTLAAADTAEALDIGDLAVVTLIIIRAIDYSLALDCDFVTPFDVDLTIKAGGPVAVIPNPAGTVYVKNVTAAQTPKFEYIAIGTT